MDLRRFDFGHAKMIIHQKDVLRFALLSKSDRIVKRIKRIKRIGTDFLFRLRRIKMSRRRVKVRYYPFNPFHPFSNPVALSKVLPEFGMILG